MFLTEANKIDWKKLCMGAAVVVLLCLACVFWLDKTLFAFVRFFDGAALRAVGAAGNFRLVVMASAAIFFATAAARIWRRHSGLSVLGWLRNLNITMLYVMSSVMLAGAVSGVLKIIIGRMRPVLWEVLGQTGFYPMHREWVFNSMPSRHAAVGFAALAVIGLLYPKYKTPVWIAAIMIGLSRIAAGAHWPSDVLLGAFIGAVSADVTRALLARFGKSD